MISSLRNKLALSHVLPIIVLMPLLSLFLLYSLETFFTQNLLQQLNNQARLLNDRLERDPQIMAHPATAGTFLDEVAAYTDARVLLLKTDGTILGSSRQEDDVRIGTRLAYPYLTQALSGERTQGIGQGLVAEVAYVVLPVNDGDGVAGLLRVSYSLADLRSQINQLQLMVIGGTTLTALFGLALALGLATTITRPLRALTRSAQQIARGDYVARAPVSSRDEVGSLAMNFNLMAERLEDLEQTRQRQLATIIHELARPLTGIRAAVETLLEDVQAPPDTAKPLLEGVVGEVARMQRLVEVLQTIQKRTLRPMSMNREAISLNRVIGATAGTYEARATRAQLRFAVSLPENLPPVYADQDRIIQVLTNLLDNAFKFTPAGGSVTLSAGSEPDAVWVAVTDTGIGIASAEQPSLFQEFYQGGTAHPSEKEGMGLGLMLSREIISAHGGTLTVRSELGEGAQFTFTLPRVTE